MRAFVRRSPALVLPPRLGRADEAVVDEGADTRRIVQMRRALALAERGWGRVSPNPMVGAVVVDDATGEVLGEGWHEGPGHVARRGHGAREAGGRCAWRHRRLHPRTLQPDPAGRRPCTRGAHRGRGRARSWWPPTDPNMGVTPPASHTSRRRASRSRQASLEDESRRLNRAFDRHVITGPADRHAEDGLDAGWQGRGARRFVQVDHRAKPRAPTYSACGRGPTRSSSARGRRSPTIPALTVRDPGTPGSPRRLRVVVDAAGRVAASRRASSTVGRPDAHRDDRRRARAGSRSGPRRCRGPGTRSRRDRRGVSLPRCSPRLGKRDVQGVLRRRRPDARMELRARRIGRRRGARTWRRSSSAVRRRPSVAHGRRVRTDRRRPRPHLRVGRPWSAPIFDWRPMFTGIVEERGSVRSMPDHRLVVECQTSCPPTATSAPRSRSTAYASRWWRTTGRRWPSISREETIARTSLRRLDAGHPVNLERPVTLASRLGGHIVQGHVDGVGEIVDVQRRRGRRVSA